MGQCLERKSAREAVMSEQRSCASSRHVKKKAKADVHEQASSTFRHSYRSSNTLEPRRDLPLHKIPELLAKITGSLSSTLSPPPPSSSSSSSSSESKPPSSPDRHLSLYEHYSQSNVIALDGLLRFCTDLSLEPDSYEVLLFCFLCRAKQMYSLTQKEFLLGTQRLNLADLRGALLNFELSPDEQTEFYLWTYHYGLLDGQRCLPTSTASSLWRLFYSQRVEKPLIFERWLNYLEQEQSNEIPKTITCDTWTIFPQFAKFIQTHGFQAYDDNEAWPCLFDGFVASQLDPEQRCS